MSSVSAVAVNGDWWFLPKSSFAELGFAANAVNPELRALLASAHILYKVAVSARDSFESVIALLEQRGMDDAVQALMVQQASLQTAIRCAVEGPEKVLANQQKNR